MQIYGLDRQIYLLRVHSEHLGNISSKVTPGVIVLEKVVHSPELTENAGFTVFAMFGPIPYEE